MKTFSKEQLEMMLRIYAQTKDYTSIVGLLKQHPEIDVNSKDAISNKTALDMLLDGEDTLERNETILLVSDKYGAKGLSEEKHEELSQQIKDEEELFFDAQESPGQINTHSPSSTVTIEEDGRVITPTSVAMNMDDELDQNKKKQQAQPNKAVSRTLSEEAQEKFKSMSSRSASPSSSIGETRQEDLVVEEQYNNVKEVERIDLTGYKEFTSEYIIASDLIARASLQGDLAAASSMVNQVIDSESQGAETAIKSGLSEIITVFPSVHSKMDEPRNNAFIVYNNLQKQYSSIDDMTVKSPEIIAITTNSDFQRSRKRLPSVAMAEDLRKAQEVLREPLPDRIEEARLNYQTEKAKVIAITQNFTETVNLVTDRINLNDYQTPKLDHYSAELKDIVVNAMGNNKKKFAVRNVEDKTKPKTSKTISDFEAKKSVAKDLPPLSEFAQNAVSNYYTKYSEDKVTQQEMISLAKREIIMEEVAIRSHKKDPKFNKDDFKNKDKFYELTEDPIYSKAFEEVFELHKNSQELKNLLKFAKSKKKDAQDVVDEIKADLVPMAIKLNQLNDHLDPEDRLDPKNLHTYINAVFVAQLKQHLPEEKLDPTLKNKFLQDISNKDNKIAYEYSEEELQRISDPKEAMKELLAEVGLKSKILEKAPVLTEQEKAIAAAGKVMQGIGMSFTGGKSNIALPVGGLRPKIPSSIQRK